MNRESLAWAAGLVDGEGSFWLARKTNPHKCPNLCFCVSQSGLEKPQVLVRLNEAIGGLATIYGPQQIKHYMPKWRLQCSGFEATQAVAAMLWPWLSEPKRQQFKKSTLEYQAARKRKIQLAYHELPE